jgi:hypothetical protein
MQGVLPFDLPPATAAEEQGARRTQDRRVWFVVPGEFDSHHHPNAVHQIEARTVRHGDEHSLSGFGGEEIFRCKFQRKIREPEGLMA